MAHSPLAGRGGRGLLVPLALAAVTRGAPRGATEQQQQPPPTALGPGGEPCPLYQLAYDAALLNGAYHGWQSACHNNVAGSRGEACTVLDFEFFFCSSGSRAYTLEDTHALVRNAARIHAASAARLGAAGADAGASASGDEPHWWVRARAPVHDGFWVRALFVLNTALWATENGLPFFVDLHLESGCGGTPEASCAHEVLAPRAVCANASNPLCDAYYDASSTTPSWEQYFEPVYGVSARWAGSSHPTDSIDPLSIGELPGVAAWNLQARAEAAEPIYPATFAQSLFSRASRAAQVAAWVRPNREIGAALAAEWAGVLLGSPAGTPVLGVHMRGTDKFLRRKVDPTLYFPLVDAFIDHHAARGAHALVFLATDDASYQNLTLTRYGRRVRQQMGGALVRATGTSAVWQERDPAQAHSRGRQVLLDTLLLARCAVAQRGIARGPSRHVRALRTAEALHFTSPLSAHPHPTTQVRLPAQAVIGRE